MKSGKHTKGISRMVMKAMGMFGGVQVLSILCSVVRCKLVSVWIGPAGVGLFALWNTALEMLNTATNMGVRSSSVRSISAAKGNDVTGMLIAVRRWSVWLGVAGAVLTVALSPMLSRITFGDDGHIGSFVVLAIAVAMVSVMNGEHAIMQGTGMLRRLAVVSVCGSVAGLLVSVPLFYFYRIDSVLPSIVAYAVVGAVFACVWRRRIVPQAVVTIRQTWHQGGEFIRLGIYMTIGVALAMVSNYVFVAYLNHRAGLNEVGFFQAAYTLVNKYVGLVLSALAMEYYPRLSKVWNSRRRLSLFASQEISLTLAVLVPVAVLMMPLCNFVVNLLYSSEFVVIEQCVTWMLVGMIPRATSWCMAFVILVRGDGRTYVVTEALSTVIGLALNVASYHRWGLTGIGVSFIVWYVIYNVIVGVVCVRRYGMRMHGSVWLGVTFWMCLGVAAAAAMSLHCPVAAWASVAVALVVALWQLRKQLGI
ncbi:MAG: oligosaccharide flippase family protein [Muribaculaceae bacterium]